QAADHCSAGILELPLQRNGAARLERSGNAWAERRKESVKDVTNAVAHSHRRSGVAGIIGASVAGGSKCPSSIHSPAGNLNGGEVSHPRHGIGRAAACSRHGSQRVACAIGYSGYGDDWSSSVLHLDDEASIGGVVMRISG